MAIFELAETQNEQAIIKVIGVGGGGGNAVDHMASSSLDCVEFVCANTDAQALANNSAKIVVQLGNNMTKGLGAGANPETGREAAIEDRDLIMETIEGSDMLFITAGMGGGTGTGAAPIVAEIAKEMGVLTVAVVTKPFLWEGKKRMKAAEAGIEELREYVDSLITIPNEKLQSVLGKGTTLLDAFKEANNVLLNAVQGISELITRRGLINVDFADVKAVMSNMGTAMMGTGSSVGENRAREAAERAIASPLLDDIHMSGAKGILVNITAGLDLGIGEFEEVGEAINDIASENATVVVGTVIEPEMSGEMRVTIVATGIGQAEAEAEADTVTESEIKLVSSKSKQTDGRIRNNDLSDLELSMPTKQTVGSDVIVSNNKSTDMTYLDIPAFLRRQND